ncbi:hypothetical protein CY35_17G030300 [Sphagnum magellanicum]|nr:hypothetical protein CY35_17G030300 [Sphagnum magellanicum]
MITARASFFLWLFGYQESCMGTSSSCKLLRIRIGRFLALLLFVVVIPDLLQEVQTQGITFTEAPAKYTSNTSATFRFNLTSAANGSSSSNDPCATLCSIRCKLDQRNFEDCAGREDSFVNLLDGQHSFVVSVNTSNGVQFSAKYNWTVESIPPTATVDAGPAFTNAVNITVTITFTEICEGRGGGFQCSNTSFCDLLVSGDGAVIPATYKQIMPGIVYSLQVGLSTQTPSDRTVPSVLLWTAIPESQLQLDNQVRTVQATNNLADVMIYLDFSQPVLNSSHQLQSVLQPSTGNLIATNQSSLGNRRFGFMLLSLGSVAVVTITLPENSAVTNYGTPVTQSTNVTFLYDTERPQVQLFSTSRAHTNDDFLPIVVQFTEPVFLFKPSGVTILGGDLQSFEEISETTYALVVHVMGNQVVSVTVADNQSLDIARNTNSASSTLQVRHYMRPVVSVAISSFITAGFLFTALASGALSVSSATLAAAGACSNQASGSFSAAYPSRNFLGMAGHLQIFAFSHFLAVSLPVEYYETTGGLLWLIPHVNTPWQKDKDSNVTNFGNNLHTNNQVFLQKQKEKRGTSPNSYDFHKLLNRSSGAYFPRIMTVPWRSFSASHFREHYNRSRKTRRLGVNATQFGPALTSSEYKTYFLDQVAYLQVLRNGLDMSKYFGWQDFERNMFWVSIVGGGLAFLHLLTLLYLRWRTKTSLRGALSFPRFEIFLLILFSPAICQACAFVIRGRTVAGIVVGVLLLAIPFSFILSVALVLTFAVFFGRLVEYKEIRFKPHLEDGSHPQPTTPPPSSKLVALLTGKGYPSKWVRMEGLATTFLPRYGLLIEDRKGPPRLVRIDGENGFNPDPHREIGGRIGLMRRRTQAAGSSDEEIDEVIPVSCSYKLLGCFQSGYILLDLSRRTAFGCIFGAFPVSDKSWSQVCLIFAFTVVQMVYLVIVKPFRSRSVQLVEEIALLCEMGVFAAAIALLARGHPAEDHCGVGILMLIFLVLCFLAQLLNEWYALIRKLLQLSNEDDSITKNLKMFAAGLMLPFLPRNRWLRFITPYSPPPLQPSQAGMIPLLPLSPGTEQSRRPSTSLLQETPRVSSAAGKLECDSQSPGSSDKAPVAEISELNPEQLLLGTIRPQGKGSSSHESHEEKSAREHQVWRTQQEEKMTSAGLVKASLTPALTKPEEEKT